MNIDKILEEFIKERARLVTAYHVEGETISTNGFLIDDGLEVYVDYELEEKWCKAFLTQKLKEVVDSIPCEEKKLPKQIDCDCGGLCEHTLENAKEQLRFNNHCDEIYGYNQHVKEVQEWRVLKESWSL